MSNSLLAPDYRHLFHEHLLLRLQPLRPLGGLGHLRGVRGVLVVQPGVAVKLPGGQGRQCGLVCNVQAA